VVAAATVALAVAAAFIRTASASATTTPTLSPWQAETCFTSACVWSPSTGAYVAGGDGVSITSYIEGGGSWGGNVAKIVDQSGTIETEAADVLPAFETVPGLQTMALGAVAFGFGWKIGSTINTKWLHLAGVGLGLKSGPATDAHWVYSESFAGVLPPGWHLVMTIFGVTNGRGCPTGGGCGTDNIRYYNAAEVVRDLVEL
jgi:hypothetical protein